MTNTNTQATSAIGLDVGTSRIVTARRRDKDLQFAKQLNAFVTIPFSKLTQGVLKKERIPHLLQDSEIVVYGDESERFANLFHKETRRPMGEMESSNYTGIGISFGGGLCNVCLAYLSVPVFSFSTPKSGDFIDSSVAELRGEPATRIRTIKEESFHFNGHFANKIYDSLAIYYEDMMQAVVAALKDTFASVQNMPKLSRPIPLVLSGGSAMAPGFRDRFEKILRDTELPVAISEVRLAPSPMHSTARGALVAALSDM